MTSMPVVMLGKRRRLDGAREREAERSGDCEVLRAGETTALAHV